MDDLLDLDWGKSSSSAGTTHSNAAIGQSRVSPSTQASTSSYNFDSLTRALPSKPQGIAPKPSTGSHSTIPKSSSRPDASQDAFSSLLSLGHFPEKNKRSDTVNSGGSASISRREQITHHNHRPSQPPVGFAKPSEPEAWSGWDAFESSSVNASQQQVQPVSGSQSHPQVDILETFTRSANNAKNESIPSELKPPVRTVPRSRADDPFDFSDFEDPGQLQTSSLDVRATEPSRTVPRNVTISGNHLLFDDEDEAAILSAKKKPTTFKDETSQARPAPQDKAASRGLRPSSPPVHLVGQIVEMGFAPSEARHALAQTSSGVDVEAAIEMLTSQATTESASLSSAARVGGRQTATAQRDIELDEYERKERRRLAARGQTRDTGDRPSRPPAPGPDAEGEAAVDWQKQADLLYAHASELGANVFSKANAFWTQAKQQAQKTLEDQRSNGTIPRTGTPDMNRSQGRASPAEWGRRFAMGTGDKQRERHTGKPRWMQEAEDSANDVEPTVSGSSLPQTQRFQDSDNEDEPANGHVPKTKPSKSEMALGADSGRRLDSSPASGRDIPAKHSRAEADVIGVGSSFFEGTKAYVSSARWGRSKPASPAPVPVKSHSQVTKAKVDRKLCPEDLQPSPAASVDLKTKGNELFKKGSYGEAEASYTAALEHLVPASVRRLPLLNNRANARLKNGDASAACRDCTAALDLIFPETSSDRQSFFRPSLENALPSPIKNDVNLRDSYGKALLRRAQALEVLERYVPALRDWEKLEQYEKHEGSGSANGVRNLRSSQEGAKRCRGVMSKGRGDNVSSDTVTSQTRARAQASAASAARKASEAGRERVRAANAAQAAEEAAAHSLKDAIDARVNGWKAGKETNIRALLSSLDTVVWDELEWKKVGMNEVLTDPQIKRVYTKAIARLHPDKLTPARTTLEQRLLGNAVFSVLNEAFASSQGK